MRRTLYLIVVTAAIALAIGTLYYRRHAAPQPPGARAAANCDTPAPPPPKPPPPTLPDFETEAACAPGAANVPVKRPAGPGRTK